MKSWNSKFRRLASRPKSFLLVCGAALREIFDESAYARFLGRTRQPTSRAAYAEFLREYEVAKVRRPRCC
jgi:hypothetical protein